MLQNLYQERLQELMKSNPDRNKIQQLNQQIDQVLKNRNS